MSHRGGLAAVVGLFVLVMFVVGLRVARINYLGGAEHAGKVEWLLQRIHTGGASSEVMREIAALGTNAMPTVTNYLCFRESRIRAKLRSWIAGQKRIKWRVFGETDYRTMAFDGAKRVGGVAGPYVVSLFAGAPLRYDDDSPARQADRLLRELGSVSLCAVNDGLASLDLGIRGHCALAIANHSDLRHAMTVTNLVNCAADRDPKIRAAAMLALGRVMELAELSVPALAKGLEDEHSAVRFHAVHSLWAFGSQAKPALPALKEAIELEPERPDAGFDQQPLGPKSK